MVGNAWTFVQYTYRLESVKCYKMDKEFSLKLLKETLIFLVQSFICMDIKYFSFAAFHPSFGVQRQELQLEKLYKIFFKNMMNKNATWTTDSILLLSHKHLRIFHIASRCSKRNVIILSCKIRLQVSITVETPKYKEEYLLEECRVCKEN